MWLHLVLQQCWHADYENMIKIVFRLYAMTKWTNWIFDLVNILKIQFFLYYIYVWKTMKMFKIRFCLPLYHIDEVESTVQSS